MCLNCLLQEEMEKSDMMYPLGGSLFAYVKTRKGVVNIHLRHFAAPVHTKGGRLIATQKGVTMDAKALQRLINVQKKLKSDFQQQTEAVKSSSSPNQPKPTYSPAVTMVAATEQEFLSRGAGGGGGGGGEEGSYLQQLPESAPFYHTPHVSPSTNQPHLHKSL